MDPALLRRWEEARAAWPGVDLEAQVFAGHVRDKLSPGAGAEEIDRLDAAGLYLACACARGDARAMEAFDRHVLARVPEFLTRLRASSELPEEVRQLLRARLLVATDGAPPRIAAYSGGGALAAWVRTAAVRVALNLLDNQDERGHRGGGILARAAEGPTPEDAVVLHRQREVFRQVLEEAVSALPSQQRTALRLHFAEGLTGDEVAERLGVSRATVVRWLAAARALVLRETRRSLVERLRLSASEADSFIAGARSRLSLSLSALFAAADD